MTSKGHNRKKPGRTKAAVQQSLLQKKTNFDSFADLAEYAGPSVFIIARLRQESGGNTRITTLGTGFLVGDHRMMTCSHVIDNAHIGGSDHIDGDLYLFAQKNHPNWFQSRFTLTKGLDLFTYPDNDSAVIYLPDSFYYDEVTGNMFKDPSRFLSLDKQTARLATDVGVLGYPMQHINFKTGSADADIDTILLRADSGVINSGYVNYNGVAMYDFTMGFNPGNSGGPIMDLKTGKVVAMVHGYQSLPINAVEEEVEAEMLDGTTKTKKVVSAVRALYSQGLCSLNYLAYEGKHDVSFR